MIYFRRCDSLQIFLKDVNKNTASDKLAVEEKDGFGHKVSQSCRTPCWPVSSGISLPSDIWLKWHVSLLERDHSLLICLQKPWTSAYREGKNLSEWRYHEMYVKWIKKWRETWKKEKAFWGGKAEQNQKQWSGNHRQKDLVQLWLSPQTSVFLRYWTLINYK